MSYQCYGCQEVFEYKDLGAECMCERGEAPYSRGVCKMCIVNKTPLNFGEGENPAHHHLRKIHQYSEESTKLWKEMEEKCPCWSGMSFDKDGYLTLF